jgi:hypothetical protein
VSSPVKTGGNLFDHSQLLVRCGVMFPETELFVRNNVPVSIKICLGTVDEHIDVV